MVDSNDVPTEQYINRSRGTVTLGGCAFGMVRQHSG
eukprot:COSAG05_NODE_12879_length_450_cov_55.615385_1_plen_35_part_10